MILITSDSEVTLGLSFLNKEKLHQVLQQKARRSSRILPLRLFGQWWKCLGNLAEDFGRTTFLDLFG